MNALTPALEEMQTATRSITSMELELSMLRASKPAQMTVPQANAILDTQVSQLQAAANKLAASRAALADMQARQSELKDRLASLAAERETAEKAAEAVKKSTRDFDGSLARQCRWYSTATELLKGLLGVTKVERVNESLRISYRFEEDKEIVLDLRFDGKSGKLVGAEVNSAFFPFDCCADSL